MLKTHGITVDTPKNLIFTSAVIYKNLKWASTEWQGTPLGATSGGVKCLIEPEYTDAELDGAGVLIKGAKQKVGEKGVVTGQFTEIKEGIIVDALHLEADSSGAIKGFKHYKTKALLSDKDYLENIAVVGTLVDGRQCIIVYNNAFCTSALELETQNKKQATYELEFVCHATPEQADLYHLPIDLYFPDPVAV